LPSNYVVFFDNNIVSEKFNFGTLASIGYDKVEFQVNYLRTVIEIAIESKLSLVYKIKRPSSQKLPTEFKQFLQDMKIKHSRNFIIVESDISPQALIENATAVICKPLSTTALIAKHNSSKVVFFDPTGRIMKNDPSLRGLEIITSVKELKNFMTGKKL
jgi:polysaccharide biosynthesis PFTS motif protein